MQSHSEVVNKQPRVLIIGYGWVGQYCGAYFTDAHYVESDGVVKTVKYGDSERIWHADQIPMNSYDLAIITVPTPMREDGSCDTSIVEDVVKKYQHKAKYFLIKSTVSIGTTKYLRQRYGINIAMSPEYVGETLGHPLTKPNRDTFLIIGAPSYIANKISEYWRLVLHANSRIIITTDIEAEIIKYCENYWITSRVDYWNDVYTVCRSFGSSFDSVREGLLADPRLGRTHSFVYPDNRGWAGKCLPKDMSALAKRMREKGQPLTTLEQMLKKNVTQWRPEPTQRELQIIKEHYAQEG